MEDDHIEQTKPSTGQSSGFKLPPPTGVSTVSTGFKLPPPTPIGNNDGFQIHPESDEADNYGTSVPLPPPTGWTGQTNLEDRDSGMFAYSRPGTRAGNGSYYASPRSAMGTGYTSGYGGADASHFRGATGRPLTAFAIPEEEADFEHMVSPAAAIAAAYRDGQPAPRSGTRGSLNTPVIELDERIRSAVDSELEGDMSSPSGTGKTDFE
jgi:hypothetical protein